MGEKPQDLYRHPNQDKWDRRWSKTLAGNQSTDLLRSNLERTRKALSGESPNGRGQSFNTIHEQTLQEALGERGIATQIVVRRVR